MKTMEFSKQFEALKSSTQKALNEMFPLEGKTHTIEARKIWIDDNLEYNDLESQKQAKLKDQTWGVPVYADLVLKDNKTGKIINQESKVRLMKLPKYTPRASFIVRGNEYQFTNQMRLKPGVYTVRAQNDIVSSYVNTSKGKNFRLFLNPQTNVFTMDIGGGSARLYPVLKILGISDASMKSKWGEDIFNANADVSGKNAQKEFSKVVKSFGINESDSVETMKDQVLEYMKKAGLDKVSTGITLGKEYSSVSPDMILDATKKLLNVNRGIEQPDDKNSSMFKDVYSVEDFMEERLLKNKTKLLNKLRRNIDNKNKISDIINLQAFNSLAESEFYSKGHASVTDQTNPITMLSDANRVTILGEGGITNVHKVTDDMRSLHPTHFGIVDPTHTPEGEAIGATLRLAVGARKDGKVLKTQVFNTKTKKSESLDPVKLHNSVVTLPDQFEYKDGKFNWANEKVKAMHKGEIIEVDPHKVDYAISRPSNLFDISSNLIPFLQNNHGNRVMMANNQMVQALPLVNREKPLVVPMITPNESMYDIIGRSFSFSSPVDGEITSVTKKRIVIKDKRGKLYNVNLYDKFPLNDKTILDSEPVVKTGDKVKEGQLIADSNFTKGGTLAIGINLRTAIMPYKGLNFEDGIVITQSAANKLSSEHSYGFSVELTKNSELNRDKFRRMYPTAYKADIYEKYDDDGVIKKGSIVNLKDPLILLLKKETHDEEDAILGRFRKSAIMPMKNKAVEWEKEVQGIVTDVIKSPKGVKVFVRTVEPATIGDKLTNRSGAKGVIAKVIQDSEAPRDKEGNPVEVLFNPHGIVSRMNIGQVLEGASAKVALKTGVPIKTINFQPNKNYFNNVKKLLDKHGVSETEELFDPETGKSLGQVFVGNPYTLKLYKQSTTNFSARSRDKYDAMTMAPIKGGETGGKSLDLLTFYSMLAHGASHNIREMATYKAEKNDDFWVALQNNGTIPPPKPTFAFNKFIDMLKASGIDVKKEGTEMTLAPLTDKEILRVSNGALVSPEKQFRSDKTLVEEKGGMFDPLLTGGKRGTKWTHIKLSEPIPNPIFEGPIIKILNIDTKKFNGIMNGSLKVNSDGKIDNNGTLIGGEAIKTMLDKIDIKKELLELQTKIKSARENQLDAMNKRIKYLRALDSMNIKPSEAYILNNVPVIPPIFRPVIASEDSRENRLSPVNHLYKILSLNNQSLSEVKKMGLPQSEVGESRNAVYDSAKALFGLIDPKQVGIHGEDVKGFLDIIAGDEPKSGFFQNKILKRRQDVVGRGTIIPDPNLHTDEVAIPEKMAWKIYDNFIIKEFRSRGYTLDAARKQIEEKTPTAKAMLELAMSERPVLLNRAPSLHKFSIMAFRPKITSGTAIKIPPMITKGYGADHDGDTMFVHVPVTNKAVEEAKKMFPSKHLYNPGTQQLMLVPSEAAALGLYRLSKTKDGLSLINKLVKKHIPSFKTIDHELDKKGTAKVLDEIAKTHPSVYDKIADGFRELGDKYAYSTGSSISLKDFEPEIHIRDTILNHANKKAEAVRKSSIPLRDKVQKIESIYSEADRELKDALKKKFEKEGNLFYDMVRSGARGNLNQVKQIVSTPILVKDYKDDLILSPIKKSLSEGLDVADFWNNQQGARKGMIDKGLQTSEPGAFNKMLMSTTIDTVVAKKDCKTNEGVFEDVKSSDAIGRYLAKDVKSGGRTIVEKGALVNSNIQARLAKAGVRKIEVRSPLKCRLPQGVCSKCYGVTPEGHEHEIGDNVGAVSGQALSEPLTQMVLKCTVSNVVFMYEDKVYSRSMEDIFNLIDVPTELIDGKETKKLDNAFIWDKNGWIKAEYIQRHKPEVPVRFVSTDTGDSLLAQENHPIFTYSMPKCKCGYHNHTTRFENKGYTVCECTKCKRVESFEKSKLRETETVKPVSEVNNSDYLWISKRLPKINIDNVDASPYIIGFYLAKGCLRYGDKYKYKDEPVSIILNQYADEIKDKVEKELKNCGYNFGSHEECVTIYDTKLAKQFENLLPGYSYQKRMNFDFLFMDDKFIADILSGAVDGNGTVVKKKDRENEIIVKYYSSSFILVQQLSMICNKLGISYNTSSYLGNTPNIKIKHRTETFILEFRLDKNTSYLLRGSYKISNNLFDYKLTYKNPIVFGPAKVRQNKEIYSEYEYYVYDVKTSSGSFMAGFIRNHNTFHTGSILGTVPVGYEKVKTLLSVPEVVPGKATLAQDSGKVEHIEKAPAGGYNVKINGIEHYVPATRNLEVKKGQKISKGEAISSGIIDPKELLKLKGFEDTQKYLVNQLKDTYNEQGINVHKKMFETVVKSATDTVRVTDPGSHPEYVRGDIAPYGKVQHFNNKLTVQRVPLNQALGSKLAENIAGHKKGTEIDGKVLEDLKLHKVDKVKVELQPVKYDHVMLGLPNLPFHTKDWLRQMGFQHLQAAAIKGAAEKWKSDVADPFSPIPQYAYGALFGLSKPREV